MTGEALSNLYHRSTTRACSLARRAMTGQPWVILDVTYRALLQRPPDPHARSTWLPQLKWGGLSVEQLGRRIMDSDEFRVLAASTSLGESLHRSRCDWVRALPPARRIMDLGGTHLQHEHGALITMGYPYPFDELLVIDLPPDERHRSYNKGACDRTWMSVGVWSATPTTRWPSSTGTRPPASTWCSPVSPSSTSLPATPA